MSAFEKERTRTVLTYLDCYGLYREAGINQYMTIEALEGNAEFVAASQADMEAGVEAPRAENVAATQYAGEVLMAVGAVVLAAGSGTVVGAVVGALVLAVGAILSFFADLFYPPCDKYHCYGYTKDTIYRINTYKERTKALVGVQQVDDSKWHQRDDCGCDRKDGWCLLVQYMHDGLVMRGQNWNTIEDAPAESGEVRGANALVMKDKDTKHTICNEHWRAYMYDSTPLSPKTGKRILRGGYDWPELYIGYENEPGTPQKTKYSKNLNKDSSARDYFKAQLFSLPELWEKKYGSREAAEQAVEKKRPREPWDEPWKNRKQTYYYRAWRVSKILYWMMGDQFLFNNILCRTTKCLQETLNSTVAVGEDSAFNQKRRRGSRWYATIVWMMQDIWKAGQHLIRQAKTPAEGWTQFGQILQDSGCNEWTLNRLRKMAEGKKFSRKDAPWPFFPLFQQITIMQMREILMNLKPHFPYEYRAPVTPQPYGEAARARMSIVVPVLEPITFDQQMQPIPAKLSSTGPGLGTIMLGLGAAAVGTYALYKMLAPAEK